MTTNKRQVLNLFKQMAKTFNESSSKHSQQLDYVKSQFLKHETTSKLHCKEEEEMKHLAQTYATYLTSQKKWKEVHNLYHSKGERSVEETARIVGFKLPHDPK